MFVKYLSTEGYISQENSKWKRRTFRYIYICIYFCLFHKTTSFDPTNRRFIKM